MKCADCPERIHPVNPKMRRCRSCQVRRARKLSVENNRRQRAKKRERAHAVGATA